MTAQIALIGGIVSHVNQINKASTHETDDTTSLGVTGGKD